MSSIRILVADDYADWRRKVCLLLQANTSLQVICEVDDGPEAIEKAGELKPDLILLDIGLPTLSGIEAAHQIRLVSPSSKILFLTLNNSPDVLEAALSTGALGYVHKLHAVRDLVAAIDAVLRDQPFVSASVKADELTKAPDKISSRHEVEFYSDDAVLVSSFSRFIAVGLDADNAVVLMATKSHLAGVINELRIQGVDIDLAICDGRFVPLDAHEALSAIMPDDRLDEGRFADVTRRVIEAARAAARGRPPRVSACSEAAFLLWEQGMTDAAIRLEQLWDRLANIYDLGVLCGYALNAFRGGDGGEGFQRIFSKHSRYPIPK